MKLNTILLISALTLGIAGAQAQTTAGIQSKADYQRVKESINAISQKLYAYGKQYPAYEFSAEYSAEGKVIAMKVTGVANDDDARQMSLYLLELENLGQLVRNMDANYLPSMKGNAREGMLSENEAKEYVPLFNTTDPVSSAKGK